MSRWLSPLMAFCLSFMLMITFAPIAGVTEHQIDFWGLWLITVLVLALPLAYLEFALVKRAKTTILNALMSLTREADASSRWRIAGWLSVVFIPFLAGAMLANAQINASHFLQLPFSQVIGVAGLGIVAFALSFLPRPVLVLLSAVGTVASIVLCHVFNVQLDAWHVTPVTFKEWGSATVLALVASGLGLGIYAQNSQPAEQATASVMPIWVAQILAVIVFGFFAVQAQVPALTVVLTVVFGAGLLLQLAKQQLQERRIHPIVQFVFLLVPLFVWAVPMIMPVLNVVTMLWGLVICLIYAVFAGWIMKISHLRKAMNFSNEVFYNIWRIAVRVVLPLSIIVAMVAVITGLF